MLSVILPVYDVREYLLECVRSLRAQDFEDFEVVAVDDGSTDGSGAMLDEIAREDRRFTVVHQANAGLGAARNRGIAAARGELLTFLDPDDVLPKDAYRRLVGSLQASGSELAVGTIDRFEGDAATTWRPRWSAVAHARARAAVTIEEAPEALYDIVACNRVVRRELWDRVVGTFPEGVVYEDHVPILRLYLEADRFDLLDETTYLWRRRLDESSLAQQKHQLSNLQDRVLAKEHGLAAVDAYGSPQVHRWYVARVLGVDLPPFLRGAAEADDAYWRAARDFAVTFAAHADRDPDVWQLLETHLRVAAWLAAHDRRDGLAALFARQAEVGASRLPVTTVDGDVRLDLPALSEGGTPGVSDVPVDLLRYAEGETALRVTVTDVAVAGERLVVTARARVRRLGARPFDACEGALTDGTVQVPATVRVVAGPTDGTGTVLELSFDLAAVRAATGRGAPLHLVGSGTVAGVRRETELAETAMHGRLRGAGLALAPGLWARRTTHGLTIAS